jgi:CopG family nickel-responsive transcriptional regulator
MKSDLARVSISLEDSLLETFDAFIDERGYNTRSEAIRDLIREKLLGLEDFDDERMRVGVLSLVYAPHSQDLAARLATKQRQFSGLVMASTQVQLGDDHCLQVIILRGPAGDVRRMADSLLSTKGVLHGDLRYTGDESEFIALAKREATDRVEKLLAGA